MSVLKMAKWIRRFTHHGVRAFGKNEKGISALEFALVSPVLIGLFFGAVEVSFLMRVNRKVATATATLGDLTARAQSLNNAEILEVFDATRLVFEPFSQGNAEMTISSLINNNGVIEVLWSDEFVFSEEVDQPSTTQQGRAVDSVVDSVPVSVVPNGETIILAEIDFNYEPQVGVFLTENKSLQDSFYLRPRLSAQVDRLNE